MANVVLRPWVKVVGVIAVVAAIMFGASKFFGGSNDGDNKSLSDSGGFFSGMFSGSDDDVITIGTNTYAGFLPFIYLNNGLESNEDCHIYKEYGLKLKIVVQDDFAAGRTLACDF